MRIWLTLMLILGGYELATWDDLRTAGKVAPVVEEDAQVTTMDGGSSFPPRR
ncbi:MAG TPA: hypothetical protein VF310_11690 [Vicinamibacteria bacterium]